MSGIVICCKAGEFQSPSTIISHLIKMFVLNICVLCCFINIQLTVNRVVSVKIGLNASRTE